VGVLLTEVVLHRPHVGEARLLGGHRLLQARPVRVPLAGGSPRSPHLHLVEGTEVHPLPLIARRYISYVYVDVCYTGSTRASKRSRGTNGLVSPARRREAPPARGTFLGRGAPAASRTHGP